MTHCPNIALQQYLLNLAENHRAIRICALGAGPGTELLGIAKFFEEKRLGFSVRVDFLLLDRVQEWMDTWLGIRDQIHMAFQTKYGRDATQWPIQPNGNLFQCDVTQLNQTALWGNVWQQDIYVLNFILSEIFTDNPGLRTFMTEIVRFAPQGSYFVFIDRNGPMWANRMEGIARDAGLSLTPSRSCQRALDDDEEPAVLGRIYDVLGPQGKRPRLRWDIVYRVGIKE